MFLKISTWQALSLLSHEFLWMLLRVFDEEDVLCYSFCFSELKLRALWFFFVRFVIFVFRIFIYFLPYQLCTQFFFPCLNCNSVRNILVMQITGSDIHALVKYLSRACKMSPRVPGSGVVQVPACREFITYWGPELNKQLQFCMLMWYQSNFWVLWDMMKHVWDIELFRQGQGRPKRSHG